jgi:hypothetical protein
MHYAIENFCTPFLSLMPTSIQDSNKTARDRLVPKCHQYGLMREKSVRPLAWAKGNVILQTDLHMNLFQGHTHNDS